MLNTVLRALSMAFMLLKICVQSPDNLRACVTDHHVWLWPEVVRAWELYSGRTLPYQDEADRLEGVNLKEDPNDFFAPQPRRRS